MATPDRVLLRRHQGGWGDQICCLVALRAARQRWPESEIIYAIGELYYATLYQAAMDEGANDCISPDKWSVHGDDSFIKPFALDSFDVVVNLDGPEVEHAHQTDWNLTANRLENWCDAVGHRPVDMRPKLRVQAHRRLMLVQDKLRASGLEPFTYVMFQWTTREKFKDYPQPLELVDALTDAGHKVMVVHDAPLPDLSRPGKPVWDTVSSGRTYVSEIIALADMAQLVVTPDSMMLHVAAAVGCPAIGLFSGTDGELTSKYYQLTTVLQNKDVRGKACAESFPCYGFRRRNYWCEQRDGTDKYKPWCLEQISPHAITETANRLIRQDHVRLLGERINRVSAELEQASTVKVDKSRFIKMGKKHTLVLGTAPGIGDSLWTMVKVQDLMRRDDADGLVVCLQKSMPARGKEFIERFDFVDECRYEDIDIHPKSEYYIRPDGTYNYVPAMPNYRGLDWIAIPNGVLEQGGRLESWLPEYECNWEVMLDHFRFMPQDDVVASSVAERLQHYPYVVFFLGSEWSNTGAGHCRARLYSKAEWAKFGYIEDRYDASGRKPLGGIEYVGGYEKRPPWQLWDWLELARLIVSNERQAIVLVGAKYDRDYAERFEKACEAMCVEHGLCDRGLETPENPLGAPLLNVVGKTHIAECYRIIQGSRACFGYQSGVPIVSVFLGHPTVCWWRAHGDSIEPPSDGCDESRAGLRFVTFQESMASAWAPPWSIEQRQYMPLIYGRQNPADIHREASGRGWFTSELLRGKALVDSWRSGA